MNVKNIWEYYLLFREWLSWCVCVKYFGERITIWFCYGCRTLTCPCGCLGGRAQFDRRLVCCLVDASHKQRGLRMSYLAHYHGRGGGVRLHHKPRAAGTSSRRHQLMRCTRCVRCSQRSTIPRPPPQKCRQRPRSAAV